MPYYSMFLIAVLASITSFILQRKHLLMCLLTLEATILSLIILMTSTIGSTPYNNLFLFIAILTFGACEASLGLSLLVSMTRTFGNDSVNMLSMNKC